MQSFRLASGRNIGLAMAASATYLPRTLISPLLRARELPSGDLEPIMTMMPTTSLVDRAGLDRDRVKQHLNHGLEGADDGELFLEYCQSESLLFDNGRLKHANYD